MFGDLGGGGEGRKDGGGKGGAERCDRGKRGDD